jgi:beta-glucanase (GH16 family)
MPRMFRRSRAALVIIAAVALAACGSDAPSPAGRETPVQGVQPPPAAWTLAWSDEFDGAAGTPVDGTRWVADTGGTGWGNQEREYYTPGAANASLDGSGALVITARAEPANTPYRCWYGSCRFTSARLQTSGRLEATYGRFEARIRLPRGQGVWPAFWMLAANCDGIGGWPKCGEIDVVESVGQQPAVVFGTLHGPGYSGGGGITKNYALSSGTFSDDFHVFAVEWTPGQVRWLVDEKEYQLLTPGSLPAGSAWVFDHPFFLIMNVAVGGGRPGEPDSTTTFPQQMVVDYVRVYRH